MDHVFKIIVLAAIVLCCGCTSSKQNDTMDDAWQAMRITDNLVTFLIYNHKDTSDVFVRRGVTHPPSGNEIKTDTLYTRFTQAEKDSIYVIVNDLFTTPITPKEKCFEFTGSLILTMITNEQVQRVITYRSTCDWSELSPGAKQLANILARHRKLLKRPA